MIMWSLGPLLVYFFGLQARSTYQASKEAQAEKGDKADKGDKAEKDRWGGTV